MRKVSVGQKRKAMELDAKGGCKKCGILFMQTRTRGQMDLCQPCKFAENGEISSQTPCGQRYCKLCGFLIEPMVPNQYEPHYCSACTLKLSCFIQPEDFSKASAKCTCELCSMHMLSPPGKKYTKLSIEPAGQKIVKTVLGSNRPASSDPEASKMRESLVEERIRDKWEREQLALKKELETRDCPRVKKILQALKNKDTAKTFYIGGVDISFIKGNNVDACAALIIVSFPDLKVVYRRLEMIQLTAPYIPGFLAFREVDSIIRQYKAMLKEAPQYKPDVIMVDGNGQLHPRGFGLACHLGVLLNVACVGVAKTLIHVDGIEDNADHKAKKQSLRARGDTFPLVTREGLTLGKALRSTDSAPNPIYVSVGHQVSLASAVTLVQHCCKYRIPEPTRFADLYSRDFLAKDKHDPEVLIVREGDTAPNEWA